MSAEEQSLQENIDSLVEHTEQVLQSELDGWVQQMQKPWPTCAKGKSQHLRRRKTGNRASQRPRLSLTYLTNSLEEVTNLETEKPAEMLNLLRKPARISNRLRKTLTGAVTPAQLHHQPLKGKMIRNRDQPGFARGRAVRRTRVGIDILNARVAG